MHRQQLVDTIIAAFANVTRGAGTTLHEALAIDDCLSDRQIRQARQRDLDTHWREVSDEDLAEGGCAIVFLDAAAYRYYLPAFMCWSVRAREDPDERFRKSFAHDALVYSLGSMKGQRFQPCAHASVLTSEQSAAVAAFLQYTATHFTGTDAQVPLDRYWRRFLT